MSYSHFVWIVWFDALFREQKSRHSSAIRKPPRIYLCPIWLAFICSVNPQFLRCHFQMHAVSGSLLCFISHSFNLLLSVSLSLSSAYLPLYFYLLPCHINRQTDDFQKPHHWIKLSEWILSFTWSLHTIMGSSICLLPKWKFENASDYKIWRGKGPLLSWSMTKD